jgi:hypothetical protein
MKHLFNIVKAIGPLALVVGLGIYFVPDYAQLKTVLFASAVVCGIGAAFAFVVGLGEDWGVLPEFVFRRTVARACETPQSCATLILGFLLFLGLVTCAIFKAS